MAVNPDGRAPERQWRGHTADIEAGCDPSTHKVQHPASRFAEDADADSEILRFMIGG